MKTVYKIVIAIVIIAGVLSALGLVLSQIEKETYVVNLDIEGVNSYPPRLTALRNRGVVKETALLSIIPQLPKLSIQPSKTTLEGEITLICDGYKETQNWKLESNIYGEGMKQRIVFKGLPKNADCIANVITTKCETEQAKCTGGTLYLRFKTPE